MVSDMDPFLRVNCRWVQLPAREQICIVCWSCMHANGVYRNLLGLKSADKSYHVSMLAYGLWLPLCHFTQLSHRHHGSMMLMLHTLTCTLESRVWIQASYAHGDYTRRCTCSMALGPSNITDHYLGRTCGAAMLYGLSRGMSIIPWHS